MDKKLIDILFSLLRFEVIEAPLCTDIKEGVTAESLPALFQLAKKHDLAHLIGDALDKNGLLNEGTEVKKRFLRERNMAVYRCEQLQYELDCICETLQEAKIPFIPLKGAVLRPLYPAPWMRTSCDIDVLVEEENLKRAIAILEEKLQYNCTKIDQHDAQIFAENGTHIELHFSLLESGSKPAVEGVLSRVWECADKQQVHCVMPDALLYTYIISHMAKHIKFGGCGIRAFVDVWILNHKVSFDKVERERLLCQAGLLSFSQAIERLANAWMEGEVPEATSASLAEYILTGGVYGTFTNKVAVQQIQKKSGVAYLWFRMVPSYKQMKFKYPNLQKCPILYPFYIVKRWLLLLNKKKRALALQEFDQTVYQDEKQENIAKLINDLDL